MTPTKFQENETRQPGAIIPAGGLVHLLLVIAVIVVVFQFIGGRRSI